MDHQFNRSVKRIQPETGCYLPHKQFIWDDSVSFFHEVRPGREKQYYHLSNLGATPEDRTLTTSRAPNDQIKPKAFESHF